MRRLVSIIALMGYLASQLAAVPHVHAGNTGSHAPRPHVHLTTDAHTHGHSHSDGHGHIHSKSSVEHTTTAAVDPVSVDHEAANVFSANGQILTAGSEHSVAIYVENSTVAKTAVSDFLIDAARNCFAVLPAPAVPKPMVSGKSFPASGSLPGEAKLFLELGALRI